MSAKKPTSKDYISDYSLKDGYGVSTYPEIDNLFREYCKDAASASLDERRRETRNFSLTAEGQKSPTIIRTQPMQNNTIAIIKKPSNQSPRDEVSFRPKSSLKQKSPHQKSALTERKLRIHDLHVDTPKTEESQTVFDGANREKDYQLILSLKRSVSREFKELQRKHSVKVSQAKKFDKDFQKMKEKAESDKMDIFKWLSVKTDFEPLKKKLRARIMQAINHTDPERISAALERVSQSREESTLKSEAPKVLLDNIPQSNNLEIMSKILNEDKSHFNPSPRRTQNAEALTARNSSPNDPLFSVKRSASVVGEPLERKTSLAENQSKKSKENKKERYKWDTTKEDFFSSSRSDAKNRLSSEIKSSNWNQLGFFPLVQAFLVSDKSKPQRDAILAKYMNGDLLSAQEFKFIADTSASINSCVDKKYLQKVVNNIDSEVIEAFEIELAENILDEYKSIKKNIQNSRHRFLTEENEECIQHIEKNEQKYQDRLKLEIGRDEQRKTKQKIVKFLDRVEKRKAMRKSKNPERNSTEPETHEIKKIDIRKLINAPEFLRGFVQRPQSARTIDVKASKHFYHPSSKLAITNRSEQPDFLGLPTHYKEFEYSEINKDDANDYKLHIKSPQYLKSKPKFRKFYSGGPNEELQDVYEGKSPDSDASEEQIVVYDEKVVEKIQAVWKGRKQRKLFREMLERREEMIKEIERRRLNNEELSDTTFNQSVMKSPKHLRIDKRSPSRKETSIAELYRHSSSMGNVFENNDYCLSPGYKRSSKQNRTIIRTSNASNNTNFLMEPNNRDKMASPRSKKVTLIISEKSYKTQTSIREVDHDSKSGLSSPTLQRTLQNFSNQRLPEDRIINSARTTKIDQKSPKTVLSRMPFKDLMLKQRKVFSAVETNNFNLLQSLRLTESDVNCKDSYNNTPLFYASSNANKEIVELLTRSGAKVNERCSNGNTPMHMAFASGQLMIIMFLLSRGGNLNILNDFKQAPTTLGSPDLLNLLKLQSYSEVVEKKKPSKIAISK